MSNCENLLKINTEISILLKKKKKIAYGVMQQVSKVILFLREGKFAARARRVRKSAE
jgi:hypothetical protein